MNPTRMLKAPIPGENLVTDTRNYSWHKPPQFPDYDDAFEHFLDAYIADKDALTSGVVMAESGVSLTSIVTTALLGMVSSGKISPDMSLLLSGPMYKMLKGTMDNLGANYLTGFDTEDEIREFFGSKGKTKKPKKLSKEQEKQFKELQEEIEKTEIPAGGLMGAPSSKESVEIPMENTGSSLVEMPVEEGEA